MVGIQGIGSLQRLNGRKITERPSKSYSYNFQLQSVFLKFFMAKVKVGKTPSNKKGGQKTAILVAS